MLGQPVLRDAFQQRGEGVRQLPRVGHALTRRDALSLRGEVNAWSWVSHRSMAASGSVTTALERPLPRRRWVIDELSHASCSSLLSSFASCASATSGARTSRTRRPSTLRSRGQKWRPPPPDAPRPACGDRGRGRPGGRPGRGRSPGTERSRRTLRRRPQPGSASVGRARRQAVAPSDPPVGPAGSRGQARRPRAWRRVLGHVAGDRERLRLQRREPGGLPLHRDQQLLLLARGEVHRVELSHVVKQQPDPVNSSQQRRPERND